MKFKPSAEIIDFLRPYAYKTGVSVYGVETKKNELTVIIDKDGGVDLDTCEKFHREIFDPLDAFDPSFNEPYVLNVTSKGADWAFKTDEDYNSHIGKRVEVKLRSSVRGKKFYDGVLTFYDGKTISVKADDKNTFTFDLKNVVKTNEYIDF